MIYSATYKRHPTHLHLFIGDNGIVFSLRYKNNSLLSGAINQDGYIRTRVSGDKKKFAHVLVMETFVGPKPSGITVNHKNGIKTDNRIENLEYMTNAQNLKHSYDVLNRNRASGEQSGRSVLKNDQVAAMRAMKDRGINSSEIHKHYQWISKSTLHKALRGATYRNNPTDFVPKEDYAKFLTEFIEGV